MAPSHESSLLRSGVSHVCSGRSDRARHEDEQGWRNERVPSTAASQGTRVPRPTIEDVAAEWQRVTKEWAVSARAVAPSGSV
jgi:hypothetical protein